MTVNELQFGFMPERGTIDGVFILRRLQEKLYTCFVDLEKAFDTAPRKVAMRKKGIPEILVRSVMNLYEGAETRVRVDSQLSEKFEAKVGMHEGSVLPPFFW